MESILTSVKKMLGIVEEYEHFDADLIMHINSVLAILEQLGVGPSEGFSISSKAETWDDYLQDAKKLELVKSYIYAKVRLIFDPPTSSAVTEALNKMISEFEWRITLAAETTSSKEEG